MISWKEVNDNLVSLSDKFGEFATIVTEEINKNGYHIKGISTSLNLEDRYFTASFAGRTIRFEFRASIGDSSTFKGKVHYFLLPSFPLPDNAAVEFGTFEYRANGMTNVDDPHNEGDKLIMTVNPAAVYIVLKAINESLGFNVTNPQPAEHYEVR